jgi:hypothetical protein
MEEASSEHPPMVELHLKERVRTTDARAREDSELMDPKCRRSVVVLLNKKGCQTHEKLKVLVRKFDK